MNCPACGSANPDDAYFCGSCGAQMRSAMDRGSGPVDLGAIGGQDPNQLGPASTGSEGGLTFTAPSEADFSDISGSLAAPPGTQPALPAQPEAFAPPPGAYAPPPGQLSAPPPQPYQPPQYGQPLPPQYGAPYAPPPPPSMAYPADGNTSGMGPGYPAPPQASGWTFAGCIPWGLFAFLNGNSTWGAIGIALWFLGPYIGYSIYVGIKGREMAWQGRRFDNLQQYDDTMRVWNNYGVGCFIASILGVLAYFGLIFFGAMAGALGDLK